MDGEGGIDPSDPVDCRNGQAKEHLTTEEHREIKHRGHGEFAKDPE
jgi:hypothetical protein